MNNIIYNIFFNAFIPILAAIILPCFTFFTAPYKSEQKWICDKKKSSSDIYINYIAKFLLYVCVISVVFYMMILAVVNIFIKGIIVIKLSSNDYSLIFNLCCTLAYIYLCVVYLKKEYDFIVFKKDYKQKKLYTKILYYSPIIITGIMLLLGLWNTKLFRILISIGFLFIFLLELISIFILDETKEYEFSYATFHFKSGIIKYNIRIKDIKKKGIWIVITNKTNYSQLRVRQSDIDFIEYSNEILNMPNIDIQ